MITDYLDEEELFFLTGNQQAKRQVKWLREHGWRYETTSTGAPRVLKSYRDQRLGPTKTYQRKPKAPRYDRINP